MRLKFLGTAAAEAIPALWCECPVCTRAKLKQGRELRRRCSYLIDSDTLIDFGLDAFWQSIEFNIDLTAIRRLLLTHAHADHLNPPELLWRFSPAFSRVSRRLELLASPAALEKLAQKLMQVHPVSLDDCRIDPVPLKSGCRHRSGDLEILPVAANHAPDSGPLIYALSRGGRSLLIANDTGMLSEESWQLLSGHYFNAAVLESTMGLANPDSAEHHLGVNATLRFRDRLAELGCVDSDTRVFANHFSHNGRAGHDDLTNFFTPHQIEPAYDGLEIEV